jgi:hypothetical protein
LAAPLQVVVSVFFPTGRRTKKNGMDSLEMSRIQFSVYVPDRTDSEINADAKRFRRQVKKSQELAAKVHKTIP